MSARPTEVLLDGERGRIGAGFDMRRSRDVRDAALHAALDHGLRRGEACALNLGDVTEHNGHPVLRVRTLKRGGTHVRLVPLGPDAAVIIAKYVDQEHGANLDPNAPLFRTLATRYPFRTSRLTPRAVACAIAVWRRRAGVTRRVTTHSWRHAFATRLIQRGADLRTVQELMGHASVASTQVYLHASFERQVEAIQRACVG